MLAPNKLHYCQKDEHNADVWVTSERSKKPYLHQGGFYQVFSISFEKTQGASFALIVQGLGHLPSKQGTPVRIRLGASPSERKEMFFA